MTSKEHKTGLNGLVLAGGRSLRMGQDKGMLVWHGKAQCYLLADMLEELCDEVFISCRSEQEDAMNGYNTLPDHYEHAGPLGALCTAFDHSRSCAWLVMACDLPLMDTGTLQQLIGARDKDKIATSYISPHDGMPEPLITIWEPGSADLLHFFLEQGIKCPRKVLTRHSDKVKLLHPSQPQALMNANTPEDAARVREIIRQNHADIP